MRGHDLLNGPARFGAWTGLVLLILVAWAKAQSADDHRVVPAAVDPAAADSVTLNARQVRAWNDGQSEWLILSHQAAVAQDRFDLRAEQVVVRVTPAADRGVSVRRVDLYAEGGVRVLGQPGPPQREFRTSLITRQNVRPQAIDPNGVFQLTSAPANFPILRRAFADGPHTAPAVRSQLPVRASTRDARSNTTVATAPRSNDPAVVPTQATQVEVAPPAEPAPGGGMDVDLPPIETAPTVPNLEPQPTAPPTALEPLPGPDNKPAPPLRQERPAQPAPLVPYLPGSQRITRIYPRNGGPDFEFKRLPATPEGLETIIIRGGVNIVATSPPPTGTVDLSADSAIIWRQSDPNHQSVVGPNGETIDPLHASMEVYLEGHVLVQQDQHRLAGSADQKSLRANSAYYDFRTDRLIGLDAEMEVFAPGLITPMRINSPRLEQYRPLEYGPDGKLMFGMERMRADRTALTGSRFPKPGYRITNRSVDMTKIINPKANPYTSRTVGNPRDPNAPREETWFFDARQNFFFIGPIPFFYWPRFAGTADDLNPPIRNFQFGSTFYFGQEFLVDFNAFKLLNIARPKAIDAWTINVDYLSKRSKDFPALGSEIGWFGQDIVNDILDPYHQKVAPTPGFANEYFGYFDIWGLKDSGTDDLGPGLAIITNNNKAADSGITRLATPPFQQDRLRITSRHMQYFGNYDPEDPSKGDMRMQLELGYYTDRYFLEEYYKRLTETGLDQETLGYLIKQQDGHAWSVWTEGNLMPWQTESQWLPRLDYYRFGDSLLGNTLTYYQHSGVDYDILNTALEVNNPYVFAFLPYDPISNTSGIWQSGRAYTNHELDLPLQFDFVRVTPYVQGQAVGWNNQIAGNGLGRVWGAAGARMDVMAWKAYPWVESELMNVHGLNHKVNFELDYRDAYSNVNLNRIGIQDDLDDNEYEYVRRYFAMTTYVGGLLPPQYDPRFLMLRRVLSPISGPTDVQGSINTLQMNIHQRLQTKRGPEGKRRIIDYMTLDLSSTYFPQASRDNFGKPFGQNMYNWQWFVGDRTAFYSYGWFEFWNIGGQPNVASTQGRGNPFGLNIITSGISISRPPRTVINIGYTVLDTGPITTSALNTSINYWLSPKWYGTMSNSYDFGNHVSLGTGFSATRIGADWLTTLGLTYDPQRQAFSGQVTFAPRAAAGTGGSQSMGQLDPRYAPMQ